MGWGTTQSGQLSPVLMQAEVPLVSQDTCTQASSYPGPPGSSLTVTDNMICAGFAAGGTDACQGDSGGPLITITDGVATQLGIVSWGEGCAAANKYGVYSSVQSLRAFIVRNVPDIRTWSPDPLGTVRIGAPRSSAPTRSTPRPSAPRRKARSSAMVKKRLAESTSYVGTGALRNVRRPSPPGA